MDPKQIMHRYLDKQRQALLAKLDGVSERDVRWPMTPTGTNLLGLAKHVASIELGYFGEVFDRPSHIPLPWFDDGAEINADMWATAEESREEIITLYQRAAVHADATIEALSLDSPGRVLWWPPEREQVTLQQVMVHVTAEIARHAGHADIIRELIDGNAGDNDGNVPDQTAQEWASYRLRLEEAAAEAAEAAQGAEDAPSRAT
ncbi:MAG TPA: DinB family protein [Propionibacteriaceae bacterium]